MVTLEVGNITTRITGIVHQQVLDQISDSMSFEMQGANFAQSYQIGAWDGRVRLFKRRHMKFPTGLISICRDALRRHSVPYRIVDQRPIVTPRDPLKIQKFELYQDQKDVVEDCIKKQRGVVRAATGWGKTEVFISLLARLNVPSAILIHRETIFSQIYSRLQTRLKRTDLIGRIGAGYRDPKRFTVCMMQTLCSKEFEEFRKTIQCVVVDECHHTPAETIYDTMTAMDNAMYRFGFSATPWRDDNEDLYIQAAFADKISDISATSLIEKNRLAKPLIYFIPVPRIPLQDVSYPTLYSKVVVHGEHRNGIVVKAVKHLVDKRKTVLVSVTRIEHGKILLQMINDIDPKIRVVFIKGEDESEKKQRTLKLLNERKLDVVVATTVYGEGVDVPTLDCLVNAKAQSSSVDTYQLVGRTLRNVSGKKTRAIVVDFDDSQKFLKSHSEKRRWVYSTEAAFEVFNLKSADEIHYIGSEQLKLLSDPESSNSSEDSKIGFL